MTKIKAVASLTASFKSGIATTLSSSLTPGRYFLFSCSELITSVSFLPSNCTTKNQLKFLKRSRNLTSSSYTQTATRESSKTSGCFLVFIPASRAIAEPLCIHPISHQPYFQQPPTHLPREKTHQLPEPTIATFSLPIFEVTVK